MEQVERLEALAQAAAPAPPPGTVELADSAVALVLRTQLTALQAEVAELKLRVNGLLWTVAAAVVIDVVKDLLR